ncbi:hypothetical protein [Methanoplanus limicola]|uniref:hypothetical protein n=1 Tax=Methanoplanus limicola TaxID=2315 RepID=UPI00064F65BD|nr:hypothetical protein [Methanoplanus limicola]
MQGESVKRDIFTGKTLKYGLSDRPYLRRYKIATQPFRMNSNAALRGINASSRITSEMRLSKWGIKWIAEKNGLLYCFY